MRRSLGDVRSKSDVVEVAEIVFDRVVTEICDVGLMVEVDGFRFAGVVTEMVDVLVLPTGVSMASGVVRTDNDRTGQTETVRAGRTEMGRGGKIDGVTERSSSTQLLETILSPS